MFKLVSVLLVVVWWFVFVGWLLFSTGCSDDEVYHPPIEKTWLDYSCAPYEDIMRTAEDKIDAAIGINMIDVEGYRQAELDTPFQDGFQAIMCIDSSDWLEKEAECDNCLAYANNYDITIFVDKIVSDDALLQIVMHEIAHFITSCGHVQDDIKYDDVLDGAIDQNSPVTDYTEDDIDLIIDALEEKGYTL